MLKDLLLLWRQHKPAGEQVKLSGQTQTCAENSRNEDHFPSPVEQTEKQIDPTKHQELLVYQPVDASLPPEEELGESTEPGIGHLKSVRNCHVTCGCSRIPVKYLNIRVLPLIALSEQTHPTSFTSPQMVTTTVEMVQQKVFHLVLRRLACPEKKNISTWPSI